MRRVVHSAGLFLVCVTLALIQLTPTARAGDPKADAQVVIASQIEAFLADDMEAAYGFAAPSIRSVYPDVARFAEMVRKGYGPVYRPGNFAFGRGETTADRSRVIQEVLISGPDGKDWTALYLLDRQPDGSWKIAGVRMLKSALPQT
jgi:hypothetical protein